MTKIKNSRILSFNCYYYTRIKSHESNRTILIKLCNEHNLIYKSVKDLIKKERRRLTKEEMLELLIKKGRVWQELDQLSMKRC